MIFQHQYSTTSINKPPRMKVQPTQPEAMTGRTLLQAIHTHMHTHTHTHSHTHTHTHAHAHKHRQNHCTHSLT